MEYVQLITTHGQSIDNLNKEKLEQFHFEKLNFIFNLKNKCQKWFKLTAWLQKLDP